MQRIRYAYVYNNPLKYTDPSGMIAGRSEPIDGFRQSGYGVYANLEGAGGTRTFEQVTIKLAGKIIAEMVFETTGGLSTPSDAELKGWALIRQESQQSSAASAAPCDVLVPTDPNSRAMIGTILGEATQYFKLGTSQYEAGQAGVYRASELPDPTGLVITDQTLYSETALMASIIVNRFQSGAYTIRKKDGSTENSWATVAAWPGQFEGYARGMAELNAGNFGNNGSSACERLRLAVKATERVTSQGSLYKGFYNWRAVVQEVKGRPGYLRIRAQGNAARVAGTDFW